MTLIDVGTQRHSRQKKRGGVAVCCSVLQCGGAYKALLRHEDYATHCNTLQHTTIYCKTLPNTATDCNNNKGHSNSQPKP